MSCVVGTQQKVRADLLELYLRSRPKEAGNMKKQDWIKILNITIPKLERIRSLVEIHQSTRLVYVMALVGSERDAPLASRAVTAMLVQHWCDAVVRKELQKDAIRHATVAAVDQHTATSIAQQLRLGVRNALNGVGLESLGMAQCWGEDCILIAGVVEKKQILREVENLAIQCEHNVSAARKLLQAYVKCWRMDTFVQDFLDWGRSQLRGLPSTMFDTIIKRKPYSRVKKGPPPGAGSHRAEGRSINRGARKRLPQKQENASATGIIVELRTVSSDEEGDHDDGHTGAGYISSGARDEQEGVRCKSGRRRYGERGLPPLSPASSPAKPRRGERVLRELGAADAVDVDGHHYDGWGKRNDSVDGLEGRHGPTDEEVFAHLETWTDKNESGSSSSEEGRAKRRKYRNIR